MDRLNYADTIQTLISDYATSGSYAGEVQPEVIFDINHDRYQLVNIGWNGQRRIYGCVIQMDIINEKIWIQHNGTEIDFAEELVQLGVPKQDIVIGFHTPFIRKMTEYAIGI
jgi:hypothetical protein